MVLFYYITMGHTSRLFIALLLDFYDQKNQQKAGCLIKNRTWFKYNFHTKLENEHWYQISSLYL